MSNNKKISCDGIWLFVERVETARKFQMSISISQVGEYLKFCSPHEKSEKKLFIMFYFNYNANGVSIIKLLKTGM